MVTPRQREVKGDEQARRADGEQAERHSRAQRQRRGRDCDRRDQQKGEGVLQPAGEIEQRSELKNVEAEHQEGGPGLQALALRKADAQGHV